MRILNTKSFLLLIFIVVADLHQLFAQYSTDSTNINFKNLPITFSYYGDWGIIPGVKFGIERPIITYKKTKRVSESKIKRKTFQLFNTLNLGYYHYNKYSDFFFLNGEIAYRKERQCGFYREALFGIGIMKTFLAGNTYTIDANGNIHKKTLAGNYFFMYSFAYGIGWNFEEKHAAKPIAIFLKPSFVICYPYNSWSLWSFALETGLSYRFNKSKLRSKSKTVYRSKKRINLFAVPK